jgi:hypothetical protein
MILMTQIVIPTYPKTKHLKQLEKRTLIFSTIIWNTKREKYTKRNLILKSSANSVTMHADWTHLIVVKKYRSTIATVLSNSTQFI